VKAIGGSELRAQADAVVNAAAASEGSEHAQLAEALKAGSLRVLDRVRSKVLVSTYSDVDHHELSSDEFDALRFFDGRPVAAALSAVRNAVGLELSPDRLREFVSAGILIAE
jgi:hypothetical protein